MLVMKFGGTSVADAAAINRAVNIIKNKKPSVVVVSAISQATNILEKIAQLAADQQIAQAKNTSTELHTRHVNIAKNLLTDENLLVKTNAYINHYFSEIDALINGLGLISELTKRSKAKICAYGELLSSTIIHATMLQQNLPTHLLDAREFMITRGDFLKGEPIISIIQPKISSAMAPYLNKNAIVLTQGFIGSNEDGATTTLGREGSDYSAALIGMIFNAKEIIICKDVYGIMTADPKLVQNAKSIPNLSFQEVAELTYFGAKVLHPATMQPAIQKNIPIRIINSMQPEHAGTVICNNTTSMTVGIKSIACKENINILNISAYTPLDLPLFMQKIFATLEKYNTAIDIINTVETNLILTLNTEEYLKQIKQELSEFAKVNIENNKSLISIVGADLSHQSGLKQRIFQVLDKFNIMALALSATNITFVTNQVDLLQIMQELHKEFFS